MSISFPHVEDFLRRRVSQFCNFENEGLGCDGPFSNYNNPHFENEANCKTYLEELDINKKNHFNIKGFTNSLQKLSNRGLIAPLQRWPIAKEWTKTFCLTATFDIQIIHSLEGQNKVKSHKHNREQSDMEIYSQQLCCF